jgi:phospholipid transport system substrate-binding protein
MLACSFIVLLTTEAFASPAELPQALPRGRQVASARVQPRRPLPSPTLELRRSTEALRKTLQRRHPGWSPEADAQATSVQTVIDALLDFDEIARRTLAAQWDTLTADQRRDFVELLQKLIERRPLDRGLRIDLESTVSYRGESIVDDQATVSSLVTSYATGRPNRRSVEYKLCFRNGRWRVYDVIVEGISLVDDYREQFTRIIAQDSFDGLLRRMRKKVGDDPAN